MAEPKARTKEDRRYWLHYPYNTDKPKGPRRPRTRNSQKVQKKT